MSFYILKLCLNISIRDLSNKLLNCQCLNQLIIFQEFLWIFVDCVSSGSERTAQVQCLQLWSKEVWSWILHSREPCLESGEDLWHSKKKRSHIDIFSFFKQRSDFLTKIKYHIFVNPLHVEWSFLSGNYFYCFKGLFQTWRL